MSSTSPTDGEMDERSQRQAVSRAYELGFSEGWNAALAKVQAEGLDRVLETERVKELPGQLPLPAGSARPAS